MFSFRETRIAALGIARPYGCESPKSTEFGTAVSYWEAIGWTLAITASYSMRHSQRCTPSSQEVSIKQCDGIRTGLASVGRSST